MANVQEIINFTQQLVSTLSQNGLDSEKAVAKLVFDKLTSFGFTPQLIGPEEHPSVTCLLRKEGSAKSIWLESCLDTVPAGDPSKWEYPPFEGRIVGNKMYGRGVADAKVAIALFCYLAKELTEDRNFGGSLFLGFDAEEQSGNFSGIREVVKQAPPADICMLGYQGIEEISIGARGWLRLTLTTQGKSAHTGSRSKKGVNAIHAMSRAISALTSLNLDKKVEPFFEFGSSLNVSQINGGVAINIVPDKCEAKLDLRLIPSQSKDETLSALQTALENLKIDDPLFAYSLEVLQYEPAFLTNPQNKFVPLLKNTAQIVLKKVIPLVASEQGSVGNVIASTGVPIINAFGCESDNVHAPNEWINLESIPRIFAIYKESLKEFAATRNEPT